VPEALYRSVWHMPQAHERLPGARVGEVDLLHRQGLAELLEDGGSDAHGGGKLARAAGNVPGHDRSLLLLRSFATKLLQGPTRGSAER
jgi:hypothetical protein